MPRKEYYQAHKEKLREYGRTYLKKWRTLNPSAAKHNKEYLKEYWREYSQRPEVKEKVNARTKVSNALKMGLMTRGNCGIEDCEVIGEAHHDDYGKPLDVRWLCKQHHEIEHHG